MKRAVVFLVVLWSGVFDPAGSARADSLTVMEYEVQLPAKNAGEPSSDCELFVDAEARIEIFFSSAEPIKQVPKVNREKVCIATGVALDPAGNVVDWQLLGGKYGEIFRDGQSNWFSCITGSRCCEELPAFCREPLAKLMNPSSKAHP